VAKLTPKQQRFVDEYLIDLNATQAAIRAGYSEKGAAVTASKLLINAKVQETVQAARQKRASRTEITADRVLTEIARLAFFDIRRLVDNDGKPIPMQELDDDTAAAIAGLDLVEYYEVNDEGKKVFAGWVKKYKLADKKGSLELLGRHLGLFEKTAQKPGDDREPDNLFNAIREAVSDNSL